MEVIDTGGGDKLRRLFAILEERIPEEALRPTVKAIAADVASRAPSPSEELRVMMYGGYDTGAFQTIGHVAGQQGWAITDTDNRVRFYKSSELYLKNYIPTSFAVVGMTGYVGNREGLDRASAYTYVNYRTKDGQTFPHEVIYPFLRAWEIGGIFTIQPKFQMNYPYPLRPAANVKTFQMQKVIPAKGMYSSIDLQVFADDILKQKIKKIVRSI